MEKPVIKITVDTVGSQEAKKNIEEIRSANNKLESEASAHHSKKVARHKEEIDWNTKLTHSFNELAEGVVAAFAVEKIMEWGKEAIKAFEEAEQATNDLKFAVTNLAKGTEKDFDEMIEGSEKTSKALNNLFSPKEIQKSEAALLRMKFSTEQVAQLMPRLLDISAKTHKSLEEVSETFGKAISEGRTGALTQFGAKFKDTGNIIDNVNRVLEKTKGFAGGAIDAMDDLASKEKEAANKAELLQEAIGKQLAPAFANIKLKVLEAAGSLVEFYKSLFSGDTKDLFAKYINALTLNIVHLQTEEEKAAAYRLQFQKKNLDQLLEQRKLWQANAAGASREEQALALKIISEEMEAKLKALEKTGEAEKQGVVDLKKLSDKELEQRLEYAKDEDDIIGKYTTTGFQKEAARIEKEIAARKKANEELLKLQKEYQTKLEAIKKKDYEDSQKLAIDLIDDEYQKKIAEENLNFSKYETELAERQKTLLEIQKNGNAEQRRAASKEFDNLLKDQEVSLEAHNFKLAKLSEEQIKKQAEEAEKKEIEKSEIKYKYGEIEAKKALIAGKKTQEKYDKEILALEIAALEEKLKIEEAYGQKDEKLFQEIEEKKLELAKKSSNKTKELLETLHEATDKILDAMNESIEHNITVIDAQIERQSRAVDEQKILAERGFQNTYAQQVKQADMLQEQKLKEQEKEKKIKELQIFLNAVASYTEKGDNPLQALSKATAMMAATKVAEAVYAERGGIIGMTNERSYVTSNSFSRRHQGGGDILLHAKKGEGIIPDYKMAQWGINTPSKFQNFLDYGFNEKLIPINKPAYINNNTEVVRRLESLEETIKNKQEVTINWDAYNNMIKTEVKNQVKTITKEFNPTSRRQRI